MMENTIKILGLLAWVLILAFFLPEACDKQDKIDQAQTLKHKTYISPSDQLIIDLK